MIVHSILRHLRAIPRKTLILALLPWSILFMGFILRQTPYTWEYSSISFFKNQPIPWKIWYCTEDTVGQEAKIFLPEDQNYILYGGAKYFRRLTEKEEESRTTRFPASYCSTEKFENRPLPDSLLLSLEKKDHAIEKWIPVKSRLTPRWGATRRYSLVLLTRMNGDLDLLTTADSLEKHLSLRNIGFGKSLPNNVEYEPHSSVW